MAKVPYSPVPETLPVGGATPRVSPETPPGAFGENVGQALTGFGRQMEKSSDEIFARAMALQQVQEEADAREKDTTFMERSAQLVNEYKVKLGKDAVTDHPEFMKAYKALREEVRGTLKSDFARRLYDRDTMRTYGQTIFATNEHAVRQQRKYDTDTLEDRGKALQRQAGSTPMTPPQMADTQRAVEDNAADLARRQGASDDSIEFAKRQAVSELYFNQAKALVREKPFEADKLVREAIAAGHLWGDHAINATNLVRSSMNDVGARNLANEVRSDTRFAGRPVDEQVAEVRRRSEELSPGNHDLALRAEQRVHAQNNLARAERAQRREDNVQTIEGAMVGARMANNRIPTTVEDLTADPAVKEAWDALPASDQNKYLKIMSTNAKGNVGWTPEGLTRWEAIRGMASDPRQRANFLAIETAGETTLPFAERRTLFDLQQKLRQGLEVSPQVEKAMQANRAMISEVVTMEQNPIRYNRFRGRLQEAIEDFQSLKQRPPDPQELRVMVSNLLKEAPSSWWPFRLPYEGGVWRSPIDPNSGIFRGPAQFEVYPTSEAERARIREQLRGEGVDPSEANINAEFSRQQFRRTLEQRPQPEPKAAPKAKPKPQQPRAPQSQ